MMQQELTFQQHQAIELLASGQKMRCIAEMLGIRRETLWRWRQLPEFATAYHERQQMLRADMGEQIAHLIHLSFTVLEKRMEDAVAGHEFDSMNKALSVLKLFQPAQLLAAPTPPPQPLQEVNPS